MEKLRRLLVNQKMYAGYIDDQNIMVEVLSSGSRYNREEDKIEIIHELVQSGKDDTVVSASGG